MSNELIPIIDQLIVKYQEAIHDVKQCNDFMTAYTKLKYKDPEMGQIADDRNNRFMSSGICYALQSIKWSGDQAMNIIDLVMLDAEDYRERQDGAFFCPAPIHLSKYPFNDNSVEDLINICLQPRLERLEYVKAKLINSAE
jgi:hypothetical protein